MPRATSKLPNQMIRASAGTGKTFALSNRYLSLCCDAVPVDQILAVTFARKAAGEIAGRVIRRLADAAHDEAGNQKLAGELERTDLALGSTRALLKSLVSQLHRLRIGTLDSFFVQLAHHYSFELQLPPAWSIADELIDKRLRQEAIRRVLLQGKTADVVQLLSLLNPGEVQRSVAEQLSGLVNKMYGYYCGSTRDAWYALPRPKRLSDKQLQAACEILEQLKIPQNGHWTKAHRQDLDRLLAPDWEEVLGRGLVKAVANGEAKYQKVEIEPHVREAYQPIVNHARAELLHRVANQTEATWQLLDAFHQQYTELKRQQGGYRFDDVPRLLAGAWAGEQIDRQTYRLDAHVNHLLLDEFQDTSLDQWQAVEPLAAEVTGKSRQGSFFCVGDVKQAIYGWRGGQSQIFDTVVEELPDVKQKILDRSYRSSQTIIDVVNRVFGTIADNAGVIDEKDPARWQKVRKYWKEQFHEHGTVRKDLAGYCELTVSDSDPADEETHWAAVAESIGRLAGEHPRATIGVLVRTNATVAGLIRRLAQLPTPVAASEEGGNPLTDAASVRVVLSLLRLVDHPGDEVSRFHLAESPLGPIVGLTKDRASSILDWTSRLRDKLTSDGYGPTIYAWARQLARDCDVRELNRLLQLVELAHRYDAAPGLRTSDFVALVETTKVEDPSTARVRVMTIHQAKGLEFDIVILPELDEPIKGQPPALAIGRDKPTGPLTHVCRWTGNDVRGVLPKKFQELHDAWEEQTVNESLCVLYVAMTRAAHALHMIVPPLKEKGNRGHTFAAILRSALVKEESPANAGVLFQHGDANWEQGAEEDTKRTPHATDAPEVETVDVKLAPSGHRRRMLEHVAPSRLEGGGELNLRERLRIDAGQAFTRGTLLHAWFQQVGWLDEATPTEAEMRQAAARLNAGSGDLDGALAEFRALLAKPRLQRLLSRGEYADLKALELPADVVRRAAGGAQRCEVHRELPFAVREGETIVQGSIDRVVLIYAGQQLVAADVVDFKTDRFPASSLAEKVAFYRPQLAAYRRAMAAMYHLPSGAVTARLAFVELDLVQAV